MVPHAKNARELKPRNPENGVSFWRYSHIGYDHNRVSMFQVRLRGWIMGLWFHEAPKRRSEFHRMVDWWPGVLESYLIVSDSYNFCHSRMSKPQSTQGPRSQTSQWLVGSSYFDPASPNQIRRYRECGQPWLPSTYHFSGDVNSIQPTRRVIFGGWLSWQIYRNHRDDPPDSPFTGYP